MADNDRAVPLAHFKHHSGWDEHPELADRTRFRVARTDLDGDGKPDEVGIPQTGRCTYERRGRSEDHCFMDGNLPFNLNGEARAAPLFKSRGGDVYCPGDKTIRRFDPSKGVIAVKAVGISELRRAAERLFDAFVTETGPIDRTRLIARAGQYALKPDARLLRGALTFLNGKMPVNESLTDGQVRFIADLTHRHNAGIKGEVRYWFNSRPALMKRSFILMSLIEPGDLHRKSLETNTPLHYLTGSSIVGRVYSGLKQGINFTPTELAEIDRLFAPPKLVVADDPDAFNIWDTHERDRAPFGQCWTNPVTTTSLPAASGAFREGATVWTHRYEESANWYQATPMTLSAVWAFSQGPLSFSDPDNLDQFMVEASVEASKGGTKTIRLPANQLYLPVSNVPADQLKDVLMYQKCKVDGEDEYKPRFPHGINVGDSFTGELYDRAQCAYPEKAFLTVNWIGRRPSDGSYLLVTTTEEGKTWVGNVGLASYWTGGNSSLPPYNVLIWEKYGQSL